MSWIFPSVGIFSFDCFFLLQIESVIQHILTSSDIYHFLRAHSSMYLQMKPECISCKFTFLQRIWLWKSLLNHVGHCKSNKFRTKRYDMHSLQSLAYNSQYLLTTQMTDIRKLWSDNGEYMCTVLLFPAYLNSLY